MAKTKISEFSSTPANNTDIDSINISEGCAPSGINDAIRELMSQLKDWQSGTSNDPYVVGSSGSLTLNQGTANGVAYLNGSKVVTSGTALSFDGTNLGIGTSSPASKLHINADTGSAVNILSLQTGWDNPSGNKSIVWRDGTNNLGRISVSYASAAAKMTFGSLYNSGYQTSDLMTLDASGNLIVGGTAATNTSSGRGNITINGSSTAILSMGTGGTAKGYIYHSGSDMIVNATTGTLALQANGSGALINTSGDFLVAATSAIGTSRFSLLASANRNGIAVQAGDDANYNYSGYNTAGTRTFSVLGNGNVVNTNNSYGAISDVKLKENIVDATPKLAGLMQVRVVSYNLKTAPERKQLGVIAQELEQVFPSMVDEEIDKDEEGNNLGTTTKSVKYSVFVPMLIKAIQEQQALITQLQADVAALKA